jgi:hypothetical protein
LTGDDDVPGRPARGYIHEGHEGAVRVTDETRAARWRTLSVSALDVEVRDCIRRGLSSLRPRDPVIAGSETVRGFVIKFRNGKHVRAAEVDLLAWEGGTQVHVALPAEHKAKDLAVLTNWLRPVLGLFDDAAEQ